MEKQIGSNVSSGAEKVEKAAARTRQGVDMNVPAPKTAKESKQSAPKGKKAAAGEKDPPAKEKQAAAHRVKEARARAERKESTKKAGFEKKAALREQKERERAALQKAKEEKRAALRKAKEEKKAARAARRELLRTETKAEKNTRLEREKRERLALRAKQREARSKAQEERAKAREAARARRAEGRKDRREHRTKRRTPGFGGWLAAVISLGTACLVLATVVTAGAFRMNDMAAETESGYRSTLYEMVSACEDLDDSLGKLRLSGGTEKQRRLLTDILVDTALLEASVEKLPVDRATSTDISAFINSTGSFARNMLSKLAAGETLTGEEKARVAALYEVNGGLYRELNTLVTRMTAGDLKQFLGGTGDMAESFTRLAESTRPSGVNEAPFAEHGNVGENRLAALEEVSSSEAEALAGQYFSDYRIADIIYTGETVTKDFSTYDFVLTDENGTELFAQISKRGGKLVFFDTYEVCENKSFSLEECDALAKEFLLQLGIDGVDAVWLSDMGMVASLTYTTVQDGVRIYPETIRVRVCEEKGRVIGLDARGYLLNDKTYDTAHTLSPEEAEARLDGGLTPHSAHLALIALDGQEAVAYEFACTYGGEEYLVYVDAGTGEELEIFQVVDSSNGKYLR